MNGFFDVRHRVKDGRDAWCESGRCATDGKTAVRPRGVRAGRGRVGSKSSDCPNTTRSRRCCLVSAFSAQLLTARGG